MMLRSLLGFLLKPALTQVRSDTANFGSLSCDNINVGGAVIAFDTLLRLNIKMRRISHLQMNLESFQLLSLARNAWSFFQRKHSWLGGTI
jgi:hypothetical protein